MLFRIKSDTDGLELNGTYHVLVHAEVNLLDENINIIIKTQKLHQIVTRTLILK
jgi:hypothetical protein